MALRSFSTPSGEHLAGSLKQAWGWVLLCCAFPNKETEAQGDGVSVGCQVPCWVLGMQEETGQTLFCLPEALAGRQIASKACHRAAGDRR